ncbi:ABC transporter permease [Achromobacter marplatensis]|jgi:peptide/nickel transport system permease protein|uniref:ABC transporter permease n=1 Tax=Achromobacter marplatensis TaxID=470868 RepID=J4P6V8_9BURK|nr:ABC transporter permease [Achromobacter marplatensis]EJO29502.1 binding-protein-dependent transporter inner membrane component family protein 63 [Achromobacter marplatensis]MDH2054423.1 ABC transporter permease [Achromobacter marplatensis]OWT60010.1 ABC transporter permease [Achromobacter marplatensis]RBP16612.1 peptide/nickel transport system permease protein [Achromobacter marplatensis]CAB3686079.1 Glutathione transport system permease protein GsiC [Achromobacter marplatensis]
MLAFVSRRLLATIPVLVMVAVVVFAILRFSPGDPAIIMAGDGATPERIAQIQQTMGLDQPVIKQFFIWGGKLLQGDLGTSLMSGVPVTKLIAQRLEPSLSLAVLTLLFTLVVAIPLGILAAWRQGKLLDRAVMGFSVLGFSVPVFVTGYLLIWLFAIKLGWFNVQGYVPLEKGFWLYLHRLILPSLALSTVYVALIARITRTSVIEVMGEDFIRTARSKGLGETGVLLGHALRNAAVPIATVVGLGIALLISGVVVTESVFNIPGLGRLVVEAVLARDYPVIQGLTLFFAFVYVFINLVVDCAYTVFDPRIRY